MKKQNPPLLFQSHDEENINPQKIAELIAEGLMRKISQAKGGHTDASCCLLPGVYE